MTSVGSNSATININNTNNSTTVLNMPANIADLNENEAHCLVKRFKSDHFSNGATSQATSGEVFSPDQSKQVKSLSNATNFKKLAFTVITHLFSIVYYALQRSFCCFKFQFTLFLQQFSTKFII